MKRRGVVDENEGNRRKLRKGEQKKRRIKKINQGGEGCREVYDTEEKKGKMR